MWRGTKGGTETIFDVFRGRLRVLASLIIILAPPPLGPVVTVISTLLCSVLLPNTFPVSTPDHPNYDHLHASASYSNSLDFVRDVGLPAREGLARAMAESH